MADGISIRTNAPSVSRALRRLEKELDQPGGAFDRVVMREVAKKLRAFVRNQLRTSGQGKWKALSSSTRERTGRTLPLVTLANEIFLRQRARGKRYEVYFRARSDKWNLTQHHNGFAVSATRNKRMAWRTVSGDGVVINNRKAFVVPARRIWPSERTVTIEVNKQIRVLDGTIQRILR